MINGVELKLEFEVGFIKRDSENDVFEIHSDDGRKIKAKTIINAAGIYSDKIARMVGLEDFAIEVWKEDKGVWKKVADSFYRFEAVKGEVYRLRVWGKKKATISVGRFPSGVAIDADGKPWAVNWGDGYLKRINPATYRHLVADRKAGSVLRRTGRRLVYSVR